MQHEQQYDSGNLICLDFAWFRREIFDSVDVDRGGTISADELSQALSNRSSGEKLEGKNLEMVMKQLDTDGERCHARALL